MPSRSKIAKHNTLQKNTRRCINWLEGLADVEKITKGVSENCRHSRAAGSVAVQGVVEGGIKLKVYDGNGVTDFYLKIDDNRREHVREQIEKKFG